MIDLDFSRHLAILAGCALLDVITFIGIALYVYHRRRS